MSNPPVTASQSLLEQIESLSGIVYEMVDADHDMRLALSSAVADSFLDLSARAQQDGFRGLPELMRMLGDGLLRQINAGHVLDEADAITIAAWLPDVLAMPVVKPLRQILQGSFTDWLVCHTCQSPRIGCEN